MLLRHTRKIAGAGLAWATIAGPAWIAAAVAAIGALADASKAWADAVGSAFVGWAMAQAQADADFGIAGAIAGATAGKAAAAAGSIYSAAVSKAAVDRTRALNAVQTGFVDAATTAGVKATKAIAAAETVERNAVAKADVVHGGTWHGRRGDECPGPPPRSAGLQVPRSPISRDFPPHGRKPVVKESDLDRYHDSSRARFRPAEQVNRHGCQTARRYTPHA